jgi:hypothetical protein
MKKSLQLWVFCAVRKPILPKDAFLNRFSFIFILALALLFPLLEGCKNAPTSANNNNGWSSVTTNAPWSPRYGLKGDVLNGNMYIVGGASGSGSVTNYYGDVWRSSDGKNWTNTANPGFGGRYGSQVVAFNNQLFLIGGNASGTLKNDVWSSPDGVTWTQILANNNAIGKNVVGGTQFCKRQDFCTAVFNNQMWVIGGADVTAGSDGLNDVWSSPDGITWTQVLANKAGLNYGSGGTQFAGRWGAAAVSFNNNLYVSCGYFSSTVQNATIAPDVWSSANGSVWTLDTIDFMYLYYQQMVVNNNAIWSIGGEDPWEGGPINDVYTSTTGAAWTSPGAGAFTARYGHLSLSFNNELWVMGGVNNASSLTYFNDVWHR